MTLSVQEGQVPGDVNTVWLENVHGFLLATMTFPFIDFKLRVITKGQSFFAVFDLFSDCMLRVGLSALLKSREG